MAMPLVRLRLARDPLAAPLVAALRTTLSHRIDPAERAWIDRIEARRARLIEETEPTGVPQFDPAGRDAPGGGFTMTEPKTTLGMASAMMSLAPEWCILLLRLVRELEPESALELCTGFGISGSYQAAALELNGRGHLTTLEGSEEWARSAVEGFAELGLDRVESTVGPIAETLAEEAARLAPLDFVFIDAEHQEQATLDHFETLRPHLAEGAVIVLDDADWPGVRAAFRAIQEDELVSSSALVGRLGFLVVSRSAPRR